ncbi:MAG: S8 family serine peptidase [Oscillospiraceae bacterium]|nr:S8 family serine peptidase [Oscillospiraceae bacterium]
MCNYFYNSNFKQGKIIVTLHKNFIYSDLPSPSSSPTEYISRILDGIDFERVKIIFRPVKINDEDNIGGIISVYLKNKEKSAVIDAINKLLADPDVIYAEPDYLAEAYIIPNDPYFNYLWGMQKIKAPLAWNYTTGNAGIVVGVADSGIDYNHPDIKENMWMPADGRYKNGWNFVSNSNNSRDLSGHGTHVAGTICAVGNNHIGVTGVCWNLKAASLKIGNTLMELAAAIESVDFANRNNIFILNNSWGGRFYSPSLKYAIEQYKGLYIAAAGNSGANNDLFPVYPASYDSDNIISVAASNPDDGLTSFSNYGVKSVDIAAPGVDIFSLSLQGAYSYANGTSMAAPHVAGAAALLKSYAPFLTVLEIKDIILCSSDKHPELEKKILTGGILNVDSMIETANTFVSKTKRRRC